MRHTNQFLTALILAGLATVLGHAQVVSGPDVDTSQKAGDDNECAIAKNPFNPNQLFMACNTSGAGLFAARSTNGGASWSYPDASDKTIADGDAGQGPSACCDPTLAWDSFGNLFVTYIDAGVSNIVTLLSTNGGVTFTTLASFPGSVDQPTVVAANTTAPGAPVAVWVVWNQGGSMVARGAAVTGLGAIGAFGATQAIPGTSGCSFGDIAIAPSGAVVQACGYPTSGQGPGTVYVNIDADGLGAGGFGSAIAASTTNVGGFDYIPPQNSRSVDPEAGLAFDRNPSSPHYGRLYLVYTDETVNENNDTDIRLRWSDNNGATWSSFIRVNDDPSSPIRSQFLPRISTDAATGNIAVCWHDCRNSATNTAMELYCAFATPAGATPVFGANAKVSDGASTSNHAGVEFGDYAGLDYVNALAHPSWADTSNSTGNNPNGTANFDAYTDGASLCAPGVPSLLTPANGATGVSTTPTLDWGDVPGATSYDVQVATDAAFANVVRNGSSPVSSWTVSPALANATQYYWRVRTVLGCGSGSYSSPFTFTTQSAIPPYIPVTLEAGYAHSVSIHTDGTVWGWGLNDHGQLGDSTTTSRSGPVRAGTLTGMTEISAGVWHTLALKSDGTVWAWGDNADGQLGNGTTTPRLFPGQVPGLTSVVAIAVGSRHNLAVKSDGTVWAWGDNWGGQIGDGTTNDRLTPFQVPGLANVSSVSAGFYHSIAVKNDGTVMAWGRNSEGELGDGTHTNRYTPGPVPGLTGVARSSSGAYFTMVLTTSGTLKGWGHNYFGQLGDGTNTERTTPVSALTITSVSRVASGSAFTLAVRTDGTVWSWGQNVAGQLGNGTTTDRNTPAAIALGGIAEVAAGEDHSLARSTAGLVYGWGKNLNFQIGIGPWPRTTPAVITDESQPAPVGLMAPVGGETWAPSSAQTVSWTGAGPISVKISYDAGTTYTTLVASTTLQDVPITVPANWSSARGRVRIDRVGSPASFAQTGAYLRFHPAQTHTWQTMTVDSGAPVVGEYSSVAIDPFGRTAIAYFDRTNGDLKYAVRSGSGWAIEPVDTANVSGWFASLVFGTDGNPRIAYADGTRTFLRYASKSNGVWTKEDVADTLCTLPTQLGLDTQNRPFIAFQDCSGTRVRVYAKSTTWSEIKFITGASPSLAMEGNLPRVAFFLHTANPTQLHYLAASGTLGSFTWTDTTVPGGDGANGSSIVVDGSGNPRIAFYAANTKSLKMAKRISGVWSVDTVDTSVGDVGNWNDIALDGAGRPRISYLANGLVKVAEYDGAAWQLDAVDGSGDTPAATSIAVDPANNDRITYFDTANGDLRYAISTLDSAAPAAPALQVMEGHTTMGVTWITPGDDGTSGTAKYYEARWSQSPIDAGNFSQATLKPYGPPAPAGFTECVDFSQLSSCTPFYFGLKVIDDAGNESTLTTGQGVTTCSGSQELVCF